MLRALCPLGVRKAWAPRAAPYHCEAIRDPFPDHISIYGTAQHLTLADSASPGSYIVPVFVGVIPHNAAALPRPHSVLTDQTHIVQVVPLT